MEDSRNRKTIPELLASAWVPIWNVIESTE